MTDDLVDWQLPQARWLRFTCRCGFLWERFTSEAPDPDRVGCPVCDAVGAVAVSETVPAV